MMETINISAIGQSLVALETEIRNLEREQMRLCGQQTLVWQKLEICRNTIHAILVNSGEIIERRGGI